jgi:hypothetical protein
MDKGRRAGLLKAVERMMTGPKPEWWWAARRLEYGRPTLFKKARLVCNGEPPGLMREIRVLEEVGSSKTVFEGGNGSSLFSCIYHGERPASLSQRAVKGALSLCVLQLDTMLLL